MVTNSKNTLFKKMICATLVLSFGQSAVAIDSRAFAATAHHAHTQITRHIGNNCYAYGAALGLVIPLAISIKRQFNFEKRVKALRKLHFDNAERMARVMSMEQIETLTLLISAGVMVDTAKELNKQYSRGVLENIAYLYNDGKNKIRLHDAIDLATTFSDKKTLLAIKTKAAQSPEALARCLEAIAIANITAQATQQAAHTTAQGMRDAAWKREFWRKIFGNNS